MTDLRDLLEWLRAAAASDGWDDCPVAAARHRQAADEIERLQAELLAADKTVTENWQIDAENNRLQAHLDKYLAETREE